MLVVEVAPSAGPRCAGSCRSAPCRPGCRGGRGSRSGPGCARAARRWPPRRTTGRRACAPSVPRVSRCASRSRRCSRGVPRRSAQSRCEGGSRPASRASRRMRSTSGSVLGAERSGGARGGGRRRPSSRRRPRATRRSSASSAASRGTLSGSCPRRAPVGMPGRSGSRGVVGVERGEEPRSRARRGPVPSSQVPVAVAPPRRSAREPLEAPASDVAGEPRLAAQRGLRRLPASPLRRMRTARSAARVARASTSRSRAQRGIAAAPVRRCDVEDQRPRPASSRPCSVRAKPRSDEAIAGQQRAPARRRRGRARSRVAPGSSRAAPMGAMCARRSAVPTRNSTEARSSIAGRHVEPARARRRGSRVGAARPGADTTWPRETSASSTPCRLTAQRTPGSPRSRRDAVVSAARARAPRSPPGCISTASPTAKRDADQRAGRRRSRSRCAAKQRSTCRRGGPLRGVRGGAPRSASRSALRSASRPSPVRAETGTTGRRRGAVLPAAVAHLLVGELGHVGARPTSILVSATTPRVDAEQLADRDVLAGLRHHALVGGDHEQHQVDAGRAGHHGAHEPLVAGHVDHARPAGRRPGRAARSRDRS